MLKHGMPRARPGDPPRSLLHNSLFTLSINSGQPRRRHRSDAAIAAARPETGSCEHPRRPTWSYGPRQPAGGGAPAFARADAGGGAWWRCLVEVNGIEPMTSCLQSRRSPN
jgi:hypothetical protein